MTPVIPETGLRSRAYRARLIGHLDQHEKRMARAAIAVLIGILLWVFEVVMARIWNASGAVHSTVTLIAGAAAALGGLAFLYHIIQRGLAAGLLGDLPVVASALVSQPLLPAGTLRWMVARQRMWKGLVAAGICFGVELAALGLSVLMQQWSDVLGVLISLPAFLLPFTAIILFGRLAGFVLGSRLVLKMSDPRPAGH